MLSRARGRGTRIAGVRDAFRESFAAPAGVAMVLGLVVGLGLPRVDRALDIELPVVQFATQQGVRSLLGTIATATLSVAGLSFSVTITALTLASNQLSPRVLRSFRTDGVSQATLAALLGTSIYCIALLVALGARPVEAPVPNLSITLAVLLVVGSFLLFALFIAHIVHMLQPASIVAGIAKDARELVERPYPADVGRAAPADLEAAAERRMQQPPDLLVRADDEGYLTRVDAMDLLSVGDDKHALIRQRVPLGDYIIPGQALADVWCESEDTGELAGEVRAAFRLGAQRVPLQDVAFPVRQLADIALKGVSPSINDPTTAETAMDALAAVLVRFAASPPATMLRVSEAGRPGFVALAPSLDDLVRLGFEQVRVSATSHPVLAIRLLALLDRIRHAALEHDRAHGEVRRQAALLREGVEGKVPTRADADDVRGVDGPGAARSRSARRSE